MRADRAWKPLGQVRIEIGKDIAEPDQTRDRPRESRNDETNAGLFSCGCKPCCRSPVATFVVFVLLLVILLAAIVRSYAVYAQELAAAGDEGGGEILIGTPGGNPGQYTQRTNDAVCEVTPRLTCTCDGTPVIQVRTAARRTQVPARRTHWLGVSSTVCCSGCVCCHHVSVFHVCACCVVLCCVVLCVWMLVRHETQSCADGFGGAMMSWSGVRQASLAEICTHGAHIVPISNRVLKPLVEMVVVFAHS
eukprot:COSAG02_NODE_2049_length_10007_cov_226.930057_9_plen_249_part_00